ncbi:hypothetical protein J3Q64DRAFT_1730012 [Phycomyces blakesleeanus]|uniref:Uncharacterized protein n=2 Tax=Phycomyces blakesleeanus TaxID=4837 RepID=A0A162PUI9_PHYB8|nr:hypothetical protein PHYBLDRAFT_158219 [Phycomyces blakesleeanus NRRL 1555(-)]OAD76107.1 hypothetical protein PHYBLDRAFT_158219 [Phycomyces blakesleeanus NRRL 1555(-)]|eukprot:XP_018294147.1 hypothetical protein PHYBLDRAFT_158219 [Phycomyces blakesleeanus NRRL 1555(-)]
MTLQTQPQMLLGAFILVLDLFSLYGTVRSSSSISTKLFWFMAITLFPISGLFFCLPLLMVGLIFVNGSFANTASCSATPLSVFFSSCS